MHLMNATVYINILQIKVANGAHLPFQKNVIRASPAAWVVWEVSWLLTMSGLGQQSPHLLNMQ